MAKRKHSPHHRRKDNDDAAAFPSPPPSPLHQGLLSPPPPQQHAMPASPLPLLICSIGNPGAQYAHTLHSAGHSLLHALHALAARNYEYAAFARERSWGGGVVSFPRSGGRLGWKGRVPGRGLGDGAAFSGAERPEEMWTWWRSESYMNVSGKGVAEAVRRWRMAMRSADYPAELVDAAKVVVLHDELEKPVGKYVVRREKSSLKGHNGLKSIQASLGGQDFVRIGVGIDRPLSRAPDEVSRHVLRKMTAKELNGIEGVAPAVLEVLRDIGEGK